MSTNSISQEALPAESTLNANTPERPVLVRLQPGDSAPDVTLFDHHERAIALRELWSSHPRVLLFVRHFG